MEKILFEKIFVNNDTKNQTAADPIVAGNIETAGCEDEQIFHDVLQ